MSLVPHHWRSESAAALQERTLPADSLTGIRKVDLTGELSDAFNAIFLNVMLLVENQRIPDQVPQSVARSFDGIELTEGNSSVSSPVLPGTVFPSTAETLDRLFTAQVRSSHNQTQGDTLSGTQPQSEPAGESDFENIITLATDDTPPNLKSESPLPETAPSSLSDSLSEPDSQLEVQAAETPPQPVINEMEPAQAVTLPLPDLHGETSGPDDQANSAANEVSATTPEPAETITKGDRFNGSDDMQEALNLEVAAAIAGGQAMLNSSPTSDNRDDIEASEMESGVEGISSAFTTSASSVPLPAGTPNESAQKARQLQSGRMEQIAELTSRHVLMTNEAGRQRFIMKLDPGELGEVVIDIQRRTDGKFEVRLSAASPETRARLQEQTGEIIQSFTRQGIDLAEYAVGSTESHDFSDHSGQQEAGQERPEPILKSRAFLKASTRYDSSETGINFRA